MQVMIVGLFGCVIASLLLTACTRLSGENDTASLETSVEAATPQSEIDKAHQTHTNVVLILIDDLSHYGVTAYGANRLHSYDGEFTKEEFATESIDALAQQGIRIDRAFAYPICENTRIALMSGKRNDRNYLQPKSQHSSDITFGDAFKKAGYATGLFGKWKQTRGTVEVSGKDYISEFGWDDYAAFDVDVVADVEGGGAANVDLAVGIGGAITVGIAFSTAGTGSDTCTSVLTKAGITPNGGT